MSGKTWLVPAALAVGGIAGLRRLRARARAMDLRGAVAIVTGSSRGLGLALARELADQGCRVSMCARDGAELERARADVASRGVDVLATVCDVGDREQVQHLVAATIERFGRVDVLINNAGLIEVGPLSHQTLEDFQHAMDVMFWGSVYATFEVLPGMRARRSGAIVNITSIGGKVSVPRLLPYSSAKFATVGFSEGIHAELEEYGINVLTVVPGLMRTGSHLNARFKGQHRREYLWFSLGATLPFTSIAAEDAASRIVGGIRSGQAELILSWQANALARLNGLAPGLMADVLGVVSRILPGPGGIGSNTRSGYDSQTPVTRSGLEELGAQAARRLNQ
jgi:NAD(P)-dependent dehydrogenase (short-subunit alcohol dehydrogenase family)